MRTAALTPYLILILFEIKSSLGICIIAILLTSDLSNGLLGIASLFTTIITKKSIFFVRLVIAYEIV